MDEQQRSGRKHQRKIEQQGQEERRQNKSRQDSRPRIYERNREKRKRYNINKIKFSGFLKDRVTRKSNKLSQMFDKSISCNIVNDNLIILKKDK